MTLGWFCAAPENQSHGSNLRLQVLADADERHLSLALGRTKDTLDATTSAHETLPHNLEDQGDLARAHAVTSAPESVAITGYYAAWRVGTGWREVRSSAHARVPNVLRGCCQVALSSGADSLPSSLASALDVGEKVALPPKSYRAQPDVLRSRVRDELAGAGLFDRPSRRLKVDPEGVGISFSSSKGFWPQRLEEQFFDVVDWLCCDGAARALGRALGTRGPLMSPVAACATGATSIALGAGWIRDGRCQTVIAGAVERPIEPLIAAGYEALGALSPSHEVRPFDARRDGFRFNAGMGFLVLEDARAAQARGAQIHAYLAGQALGADGTGLLSLQSEGDSIVRLVNKTLRGSKARSQVLGGGYINAHGTATPIGDAIEARALRRLFPAQPSGASPSTWGSAWSEGGPVASSTKGLTGHLMGASGAVEAALCVQALAEGFAPPSLGLEEVDPACDFAWLLPNQSSAWQPRDLRRALSLSYGFGGHLCALLFEKP